MGAEQNERSWPKGEGAVPDVWYWRDPLTPVGSNGPSGVNALASG